MKSLQVSEASSSVTELVKSTICAKVTHPHFAKPFYSPACTLSCSDFCGSKHKQQNPKCASDPHKVGKYLLFTKYLFRLLKYFDSIPFY